MRFHACFARRLAAVLTVSFVAAGCATTGPKGPPKMNDEVRGREQLVRAFDAAWVRVVRSGRDREILAQQPPFKPGAALSYMVQLADCLPSPEIVPYPEKPAGMFKRILETGVIRKVTQQTTNTANDTSYYFSSISDALLDATLEEIEKQYKVDLRFENVQLPPGPAPTTSLLVEGKADIVDQLNALGGETQGLRRRISRRPTCMLSAVSQYIHIPAKSELARQINTWDDLVKRPDVRICTGPLATQTTRAYLPRHKVQTKYLNDLTGCVKDMETGKADVMMSPLPSLSIADIKGYKSVHTLIVTGTPLWVLQEGIECPSDGNPRTEDKCFETDPP